MAWERRLRAQLFPKQEVVSIASDIMTMVIIWTVQSCPFPSRPAQLSPVPHFYSDGTRILSLDDISE